MLTRGAAPRQVSPHPLRLLYGAQAVAAVGMAAGGTAGGLLAVDVTGDPATVVLPLGALVLGATLAVPPVSGAMRRHSRRMGLLLGLVVAVAGAFVVVLGAYQRALGPMLVGNALLGAGNTAVMFGRYVAADLIGGAEETAAPPDRGPMDPAAPGHSATGRAAPDRSATDRAAANRLATRAVATALSAAAIGATLGPNLLAPAGRVAESAGLPGPAGLYLLAVPAFALAALLVFRLPAVSPRPSGTAPGSARPADRPAGSSRRLPLAVPALLGVANATMVTMMAVTPPALHHHGWGLSAVGLLVSVHVAAMFGFSPVSGWLCNRLPVPLVAAGGTVVSAAAALGAGVLARRPDDAPAVAALVVILGMAWNIQLVSGTMLLITGLPAERRHLGEAVGEIVMGTGAAGGTFLAAPLLASTGLPGLGAGAALLSLGVAAWVLLRRPDRPTDRRAGRAGHVGNTGCVGNTGQVDHAGQVAHAEPAEPVAFGARGGRPTR